MEQGVWSFRLALAGALLAALGMLYAAVWVWQKVHERLPPPNIAGAYYDGYQALRPIAAGYHPDPGSACPRAYLRAHPSALGSGDYTSERTAFELGCFDRVLGRAPDVYTVTGRIEAR